MERREKERPVQGGVAYMGRKCSCCIRDLCAAGETTGVLSKGQEW